MSEISTHVLLTIDR